MKILHVNVVYPKGSTGKIIQEIVANMGIEHSFICYGRGEINKSNIVRKFCTELEAKIQGVINRLGGLQYGGNYFSTKRLKNIIIQENPNIVHLHCINGYCVNIYSLLDFLAKNKIKTVITHHAEFYYTGSCGHALECAKWTTKQGCGKCQKRKYATGCLFLDNTNIAWKRMKKAFDQFDINNLCFVAVSPWVKMRSMQSYLVNKYNCDVVLNGVNTKVFCEKDRCVNLNHVLQDDIICLHVTASFDTNPLSLKGGYYIVELAKKHPNYKFLIVASYTNVSENLPPNIILWGRAKSQEELAELYRRANVTIITSKRETFSMIVAESLCCGTPVVGFKAGGPESIALEEYSTFVDYSDVEALSRALIYQLDKKDDKLDISRKAIIKYDSSVMVQRYLEVYKKLMAYN